MELLRRDVPEKNLSTRRKNDLRGDRDAYNTSYMTGYANKFTTIFFLSLIISVKAGRIENRTIPSVRRFFPSDRPFHDIEKNAKNYV